MKTINCTFCYNCEQNIQILRYYFKQKLKMLAEFKKLDEKKQYLTMLSKIGLNILRVENCLLK